VSQKISEQEVAARGAEMEREPWTLPARYALDPKKLALPPEELQKEDPELYLRWQKIQEQQKLWKQQANEPFTRPSVQDVFRAQSVQIAEELAKLIERLKEERDKAVTGSGDGDPSELQGAILALRERRAHALSLHGRYDLAVEVEPRPEHKELYLAILEAVWRDDEEDCKCEDVRGSGEHSKLIIPKHTIKDEIFSVKHGRVVFLRQCSRCGFLNVVTEVDQRLMKMRGHRSQAAALVTSGMSPTDAHRVLANRGHTTAELLKK